MVNYYVMYEWGRNKRRTASEVAVLYDRENSWVLKDAQGPRNENMYYQECVLKQYRALREQGLNVDVISMEHVLDKIVICF